MELFILYRTKIIVMQKEHFKLLKTNYIKMSIFLIFTFLGLENKLSTPQHNVCDQNYSIFNQLGLNVF